MARFKLLAGQFIRRDPKYKQLDNKDGRPQFKGPDGTIIERPPSIVHGRDKPGGIFVESDVDLVKKHPNQFERVGPGHDEFETQRASIRKGREEDAGGEEGTGASAPKDMVDLPGVFPGGQVSSGHQVSTTGPDGLPISGAMTEDSIPRTREEKIKDPDRQLSKEGAKVESVLKREGAAPKSHHKTDAELHAMTVQELREHAADEEINLHGASSKDDIVKAIKHHKK